MANVALLATVADSKASQQAGGASALMPSGVILPFAGSTSPTGWIVCDGAAYSQADYPELFAALGSAYNTQVNPTTSAAWAAPSAGQFRVPDMRGLFLRGEGTASGGDAVSVGGHQGGKTAKNGIAAAASGVSGTGADVNLAHGHGITSYHGRLWNDFNTLGGGDATRIAYNPGNFINESNEFYAESNLGNHSHSVSGTAAAQTITGDNETRPTNRGVRYIIKV